ncbi:hypothetical protein HMPREF0293_0581 [Corynebacterium glucuronolyticum ATCC 51866]|nr:hypothetical protein HMPREF0293_0581 [Corynebacterium glucuronolyticum ATCC 51866]
MPVLASILNQIKDKAGPDDVMFFTLLVFSFTLFAILITAIYEGIDHQETYLEVVRQTLLQKVEELRSNISHATYNEDMLFDLGESQLSQDGSFDVRRLMRRIGRKSARFFGLFLVVDLVLTLVFSFLLFSFCGIYEWSGAVITFGFFLTAFTGFFVVATSWIIVDRSMASCMCVVAIDVLAIGLYINILEDFHSDEQSNYLYLLVQIHVLVVIVLFALNAIMAAYFSGNSRLLLDTGKSICWHKTRQTFRKNYYWRLLSTEGSGYDLAGFHRKQLLFARLGAIGVFLRHFDLAFQLSEIEKLTKTYSANREKIGGMKKASKSIGLG